MKIQPVFSNKVYIEKLAPSPTWRPFETTHERSTIKPELVNCKKNKIKNSLRISDLEHLTPRENMSKYQHSFLLFCPQNVNKCHWISVLENTGKLVHIFYAYPFKKTCWTWTSAQSLFCFGFPRFRLQVNTPPRSRSARKFAFVCVRIDIQISREPAEWPLQLANTGLKHFPSTKQTSPGPPFSMSDQIENVWDFFSIRLGQSLPCFCNACKQNKNVNI